MGPVPRAMAFKKEKTKTLGRVLARSLGHVRSSLSARNDILMFCFFFLF